MIDAPYVASFRAWENEGHEAEAVQEKALEISEEILGEGKWRKYPQLMEQVRQRVSDQVYDEAPRFVEAMWFAHARWAMPEQKKKALAYLAEFAGLVDDIFRDEAEDEAHRDRLTEAERAREAWELRHVD
jgi:hypothetical protein